MNFVLYTKSSSVLKLNGFWFEMNVKLGFSVIPPSKYKSNIQTCNNKTIDSQHKKTIEGSDNPSKL